MPLINTWADRGNSVLVDKSTEQRVYRVGSEDDFIDYKEVVSKEVEQWPGFSESGANAVLDAAGAPDTAAEWQPTDTLATFSYSMNEGLRSVNSYTLERVYERKKVDKVGATPIPNFGSVNFSVASSNNTTFPFSLTMSTTTSGALIRYKIDSYNGGTRVAGSWQQSSGQSITINVNTSNIAGGARINAVAMHKYVIIEAYAFRVLQTGTYEGPRSAIIYGQRAPVISNVVFSPSGSVAPEDWYPDIPSIAACKVTSWPHSVTLTSGNATIYYRIRTYSSQSSYTETQWLSGSNVSIQQPPLISAWYYGGQWFYNRRVTRLTAYAAVVLDGYTYSGNVSWQGYYQAV